MELKLYEIVGSKAEITGSYSLSHLTEGCPTFPLAAGRHANTSCFNK